MSQVRFSAAAGLPGGVRATAAVLAAALLTASCGLTPPDRKEARAVVESEDTSAQVQIVTSTEFAYSGGSQDPTNPSGASVQIVTADTAVRTLPYDRTFDIRTTGRLLVRAQTPAAATDTPSVTVRVRVIVDGEQRNSVEGDVAEQPVEAVFLSAN